MAPLALVAWLVAQGPSPTAAALAQAKAHVEELECDQAAPLLEPLKSTPGPEQQPALFLQGYCLALEGATTSAAEAFQRAWELGVDAQVPLDVEPKVQLLIKGARDAVLARLSADKEARFAARAATVKLAIVAPESHVDEVVGGERVRFTLRITDPENAVRSVRIDFKQKRDREFYSLPVRKGQDGLWRGEIPGYYTVTPGDAIDVAWAVVASDEEGRVLTSLGTRDTPNVIRVEKGSAVADVPARERLPHLQRLFFAGVGLPLAAAATTSATAFVIGTTAAVVVSLTTGTPQYAAAGVGIAGVVAAPIAGTLALALSASVLLDDWTPILPTAVFIVGSIAGAAAGGLVGAFFVYGASLNEQPPDTTAMAGIPLLAAVVETAVIVVAAPLTGAVAGALVFFDAPVVEEVE